MKKLLFAVLLLIAATSYSQNTKYSEKLKEMFEVSGTEASFHSTIDQFFKIYKPQFSQIDEETWIAFENKFKEASIDDLVDLLIPVYEKYLTESDLDNIIKFYKTNTGKKFAKHTPNITAESMEIGRLWGELMTKSFIEEMKNQ